jgi:hypothetical protein
MTSHGNAGRERKTLTYVSWIEMRRRCTNPKRDNFKHYGGRGIRVCAEWMASFEAFLKDMGRRPGRGYSLDREDVNGNYEPGNCRWATQRKQIHNRRVSHEGTGIRDAATAAA